MRCSEELGLVTKCDNPLITGDCIYFTIICYMAQMSSDIFVSAKYYRNKIKAGIYDFDHTHSHTHKRFLLNWAIFPELHQVRPVHNSFGNCCGNVFYKVGQKL